MQCASMKMNDCVYVSAPLVLAREKEFYKIFHYIKLADERSENEYRAHDAAAAVAAVLCE